MRLSHPITDNGVLIAVAALGDSGWFLLAIDTRLEELDRVNFSSVEDVGRAARSYLRRNHPIASPWQPGADHSSHAVLGASHAA
ncbi:MAG: hypothetical protein JWR10_3234 [Rubritepida sp.]|nr:hypothetical protein [Rubritepida sp.]